MNLADIFPRLPGPLRSLAVTLKGIQVDRRRFGSDYRKARSALARAALSPETSRAWGEARERIVLERLAVLSWRPVTRLPAPLLPLPRLEDMPLEDKATLAERVRDMRVRGLLAGAMEWSTGGTTGRPLDVPITPAEDALNTALVRRFVLEICMGKGEPRRTAYLTGKVLMPAGRARPPFAVADIRGDRRYYSMFHITQGASPWYGEDLDRFGPDLMVVNPAPAARLARFLAGSGWVPRHPPRGIWSMAEELLPADREALESTFRCRVTDTYGMTEMAVLAAGCEHGRLHVCDLYGRTETIPGPGGLREIVGTSYVRTLVPVVRFRTGDLCESLDVEDCPCGLHGQVIRGLVGRIADVVELPDGRILTASPLADVVRRVPGVVWSRFEILEPGRWRLRYHAPEPIDQVVIDEVRRELGKRTDQVLVVAEWDPRPVPDGAKSRLIVPIG
jgi:phenylacetate-CoA ligase